MFDPTNYSFLLSIHLLAVGASLSLFIVRGIGVLYGASWPMKAITRYMSIVIDSLLLIAGISLWIAMRHNPVHEPWFAIKLFLLPVYIVCGSYALKRATSRNKKIFFYFLSILVIVSIISLAHFR